MADYIGKRLILTVLGMASGLLAAKYLSPEQAASFQDFVLKSLAVFVTGQTTSDCIESWKGSK